MTREEQLACLTDRPCAVCSKHTEKGCSSWTCVFEEKPTRCWIRLNRRIEAYDITGIKTWGMKYQCPECGFIHTVIEDFGHYTFCPNCGERLLIEGD